MHFDLSKINHIKCLRRGPLKSPLLNALLPGLSPLCTLSGKFARSIQSVDTPNTIMQWQPQAEHEEKRTRNPNPHIVYMYIKLALQRFKS